MQPEFVDQGVRQHSSQPAINSGFPALVGIVEACAKLDVSERELGSIGEGLVAAEFLGNGRRHDQEGAGGEQQRRDADSGSFQFCPGHKLENVISEGGGGRPNGRSPRLSQPSRVSSGNWPGANVEPRQAKTEAA